MTRHILITGAGGFLGRNAARHFFASGWMVSGIGHATSEFLPKSWGISNWQQTDVTLDSLSALIEAAGRPEVVLHCAGSGSVGRSWDSPFEDFQRTTLSTAAVTESLRLHAPEALLIYTSSAAVYGESEASRLDEDSVLHPMSPYGMHKLASEDLCLGANRIFGLRTAIVRFFSLYGPGLRKQLLWDTSRKLAAGGDTLRLDGSGRELRDFLHVDDATRLLQHIAEQCSAVDPLIVNGATGVGTSVAAIAGLLIEAMDKTGVGLEFSGRCRPGDPSSLVGDVSRLEQLGFQTEIGIAEGIRQFSESLPDFIAPTPVQLFS